MAQKLQTVLRIVLPLYCYYYLLLLAQLLVEAIGPTDTVKREPETDIPKDSEEEKRSRSNFMSAQKLFNEASSQGRTEAERTIENDMLSAMASPAHLGKPDMSLPEAGGQQCQPDFTHCPVDWEKRGVLCFADKSYAGPCAAEADLSDMSVEQKLAFSSSCKVDFPCQK